MARQPAADNPRDAERVALRARVAALEVELRESEERFRSLFENEALGVAIVDSQGYVVSANAVSCGLLGYDPGGLVGKHFLQLVAPDEHERATGRYEALLRGEWDSSVADYRCLHRTGAVVWERLWVSAIRDASGQLRHAIVMCQEIDTLKQAEEQRRLLVEGEKMRALGEMASGVAHDLNQYLGLVAGHGELALHELDRPQCDRDSLRDSLRTVVQAAMDGANTVKRLQTFARPRQEGPPRQVDAGELLREVAKLTAPRWRDAAQARGQPIQVEVETVGHPLVAGWAESLREALTNLVFNAVDALPNGGTVRLAARQTGERVELAVADSGLGMSVETQARLFEPYFTTKGEHGTGLGLSIVYGIVARHGGHIAVESALGGGTTFRLSFPVAGPAPAAPSPAAVADDCTALRILAVDDEPALGRLLARLLEMDGHAVIVATSAEEALERLGREPFDLVLSDVGMGAGMNGWELAERVRAAHPALVFVLATGWGAAIEPEEARRQGIYAVIAKPYRLDDLRRLIASVADAQATNRSAAPSA